MTLLKPAAASAGHHHQQRQRVGTWLHGLGYVTSACARTSMAATVGRQQPWWHECTSQCAMALLSPFSLHSTHTYIHMCCAVQGEIREQAVTAALDADREILAATEVVMAVPPLVHATQTAWVCGRHINVAKDAGAGARARCVCSARRGRTLHVRWHSLMLLQQCVQPNPLLHPGLYRERAHGQSLKWAHMHSSAAPKHQLDEDATYCCNCVHR